MAVSPQPTLYPTGNDAATSAAIALLVHYFDLAPASAQLLVKKWLTHYPAIWVRAAVTEALYQGRYKPFSVEQILAFWQRREKSIPHFNKEFETIIAVPLQGSFKTEMDVAIEGNDEMTSSRGAAPSARETDDERAAAPEPAIAPDTTLAEAITAAEQDQSVVEHSPLPRPRLMLPGELPGKGLLAQSSVAASDNASDNSNASANRSTSAPPVPGASALIHPQGFDGVLDPRPRPQVTQGPDSALVANSKAKQIQPPPIGRFTPAADPSGFASRLKTVVEQAIAKTQVQAEQLSLETAIASQLANDPVLGQPSPEESSLAKDGATDQASGVVAEAIAKLEQPQFQEEASGLVETTNSVEPTHFEMAEVETSLSLENPSESIATPEAKLQTTISSGEISPWDRDSTPNADAIDSEMLESLASESINSGANVIEPGAIEPDAATLDINFETEAIAAPQVLEQPPEPEFPQAEAVSPSAALDQSLSKAEVETAIAEEPNGPNEVNVEALSEQTTPFEDRFPLSNPQEKPSTASDTPRDAIDIELDKRLIETTLDEEPEISFTPPDNDRLDLVFESEPAPQVKPRNRFQAAVEADEAAILAKGSEATLLNGEALTHPLESGLDDPLEFDGPLDINIAPDETGDITERSPKTITTTNSPSEADTPSSQANSINIDRSNQENPSPALAPTELQPTATPQTAPHSELQPDNALEISQVSSLMAGLTQRNDANLYSELSLPSVDATPADVETSIVDALEPEPSSEDSEAANPNRPQD